MITRIKSFNEKTRQEIEDTTKTSAIKKIVIANTDKPFIEFHNGTVLYIDEVDGWVEI